MFTKPGLRVGPGAGATNSFGASAGAFVSAAGACELTAVICAEAPAQQRVLSMEGCLGAEEQWPFCVERELRVGRTPSKQAGPRESQHQS